MSSRNKSEIILELIEGTRKIRVTKAGARYTLSLALPDRHISASLVDPTESTTPVTSVTHP